MSDDEKPTRPLMRPHLRPAADPPSIEERLAALEGVVEGQKGQLQMMITGIHNVQSEQAAQRGTLSEIQVQGARIIGQLSTLKMASVIGELLASAALLIASLCGVVFTVRSFGLWVGWWH